jgi:uncharacterized membrane protein YhiD involved in acid resistance
MMSRVSPALVVALLLSAASPALAQFPPAGQAAEPAVPAAIPEHSMHLLHDLDAALIALPLATLLGTALAFRPRRRGTPLRKPAVIQTQIILAIVGAVVMLVVGASLARAFAVVGAASLVRYRAKIDDPKDAGVMLCSLAIGLGAGVGLYALVTFSTAFMLVVMWVIESLEPQTKRGFELHVKTKDTSALRPAIERFLHRQQIQYELRTSSQDELSYLVEMPYDRHTDRLSNAILRLDKSGETSVEWEEKKKGK